MSETFWWRFLTSLRHAEVIFGSSVLMPGFDCEATSDPEWVENEESHRRLAIQKLRSALLP